MNELKIKSAEIKNFKNLSHASFEANENHIILSGTNGSGKTAICEALATALVGKEVLPNDPIMKGEESAIITLNLSSGKQLAYTITVTITEDKFKLRINPYDSQGNKLMAVSAPIEFLRNIISEMSINPEDFCNKTPQKQIEMIYNILPGLKTEIDALDDKISALQGERSALNQDKISIENQLQSIGEVSSYPDEPVDTEAVMKELTDANKHNDQYKVLTRQLADFDSNMQINKKYMLHEQQRMTDIQAQIADYEAKINSLKAQFTKHKENCEQYLKQSISENDTKEKLRAQINNFKQIDTVILKEKLSKSAEINEKVSKKRQKQDLARRLVDINNNYSTKLTAMKKFSADKIDVTRNYKMPVDGLTIGDNNLMFPDPNTGAIVPISSLSTGQKWAIALSIHAAINPQSKILFIKDANSLDSANKELIFKIAAEKGLQLILHETTLTQKKDCGQCEIIIKEISEVESW
jgi:DNA repair exonuclease SbcCD ATPase subunit